MFYLVFSITGSAIISFSIFLSMIFHIYKIKKILIKLSFVGLAVGVIFLTIGISFDIEQIKVIIPLNCYRIMIKKLILNYRISMRQ